MFNSVPSPPYVPPEPAENVPYEASNFLTERGWGVGANNPRNGEQLFTCPRHQGYYRWHEAVALETIGLLRVGHG